MILCLYDNTEHADVASLHKYLRKLKIPQEQYYLRFYEKRDLCTGEQIPYKDYFQYINTDFLNKNNLKKYLKTKPEEGKTWSINWLKRRKEEKNLIYPPTQVELRSLMCPSILYYDSVGGYNNICKELGYQIRFNQPFQEKEFPQKAQLIIDTREQHPLNFGRRSFLLQKLDCGDYGLAEPFDQKVYIERKTISDAVGTVTRDLGRFRKELQRAKDINAYIVMLVDSNINDALGFNYLPQMRYTKVMPAHFFKNIRDLIYEFENFQVLFVAGRKEAAQAVLKLLSAGSNIQYVDLQLAYETKQLILS